MALLAAGGLSGCATGVDAQTTTYYNAPAGTDVRTGDVKGLNMLVVADGSGTGTLVAALVNTLEEEDQLVAATATDPDTGTELTVTGLETPVPLPQDELVQLIDDTAEAPIGISGETVEAGQVLQINLQFLRGGAVAAEVPVMARAGDYAEVPAPAPEPETEPETEPDATATDESSG